MESDHQTGRTTRALQNLVERCIKEGRDGVYVVHNQSMVPYTRDLLLGMHNPQFFTRAGPNYVEIEGDILISFLPYSNDLRDRLRGRECILKYDHYIWEKMLDEKKTTDS